MARSGSSARRRRTGGPPPAPLWLDHWFTWSLAWVFAVMASDLAAGTDVGFAGVLVGAPFVAGVGSTVRRTAAAAAIASVAAVLLTLLNEIRLDAAAVRLSALVVASAVAVKVADARVRRDQQLRDVSHIVTVAQEALLRPVPKAIAGWSFAARYEPAGELGVGGDIYDVAVTADRGILAIVADVQGKGVGAVADAARLLAAFRIAAHEAASFADLALRLDSAVDTGAEGEKFVTAVVCRFGDGGRVEIANFGHPPPVLVQADAVTTVETATYQPPLGLGPKLQLHVVELCGGDGLVCFTDGLVEARSVDGEFHDPMPALTGAARDARGYADAVVDSVLAATGGGHDDDLTVLAAVWSPESGVRAAWE